MMANLHTVHMSSGLLALRCVACNHRVILEENKWRDAKGSQYIHRGNMTTLDSLKFVCKLCGGRDVRWIIPYSWDEAKAFLAGENIRNAGARS